MRDIGKNIKTIRQSKGMTQEAMAEALFVTRQTVSNYENGRSRPDLDMLLKIAEVLETDVNTILYGPPVEQSKKNGYRWLLISASIFVVLTALYVMINILFSGEAAFVYEFTIRRITQLTVLPAAMFVLGWALLHSLSIFGGLQQLRPEKIQVLRIGAMILLGLMIVIPIPFVIFSAMAGYRSCVYQSVSMTFPYIPVYQEVYRAIEWVIYKAPFVYTILGSAYWLLGLPRVQKKEENKKV